MARRSRAKPKPVADSGRASPLRIIGGRFRGRKLEYHGQKNTRPMKDRVREAVFNLLTTGVVGGHAIDLFAGTGALGLEALSRGAAGALFIERHFPTADLIRANIALLDVQAQSKVVAADTFAWSRMSPELPAGPWIVFVSPPYDLYVDRNDAMLQLITQFCSQAPIGSRIVVEADERFDFDQLPDAERWDVRTYLPARVGILRRDN